MYLLGKITVTAVIPEKLSKLKDIAYNLWWSWNSEAIELFKEIDPALWEKLGKNPVRFLQEVSQKKLEQKLNDNDYMHRYEEVTEGSTHTCIVPTHGLTGIILIRASIWLHIFQQNMGLVKSFPFIRAGLECYQVTIVNLPAI